MTRARKFLLIYLPVFLIVSGGVFYYFYFYSTDLATRHAESFLFRRMTINQTPEGKNRLFFITNRNQETGDAPLDERFGTVREPLLKFGVYDVGIEPSIGLGMFLNATEWFQNEEIRLYDVRQLERSDFVEKLGGYVDRTPQRSLLVVIHGFREAFPSALRKTAFVSTVLDINTPVLLFDWPGNQGSSLRGYRRARRAARDSGEELAEALKVIIREVQPHSLSLLANSMGGEVVVAAFSKLFEEAEFSDVDREIDHVVLTAPDVDHAGFNERFKHEIRALAQDLTVYVSSNDRALLMSRVINREKRLGESTLSTDQLDEAMSLYQLVEPGSTLVNLVDVTPVNRTRNFHNFSLETPEFYDDLYLRLTSYVETPRNRRLYRVLTPEDTVYWVLTRGR